MRTLTITEDGSQTIYHGPLDTFAAPNDFIATLVQSAIADGECTQWDGEGCEVTAVVTEA